MKKGTLVAGYLLSVALICWGACGHGQLSDRDIRSKVVKLQGNGYQCSGEQVKAPSGASYILSAGHCGKLADKDGSIEVIMENKKSLRRKIVAEDKFSDLLLIEGLPSVEGLTVARRDAPQEEVITYTHGRGYDTYTTRGVLIQYQLVDVYIGDILTPEDEADCNSMPKYRVIQSWFSKMCVMSVTETVTNAMIDHGSSGGAVLDNNSDLVGVVSAGDNEGHFGFLVPLYEIKRFLSGY